MKFLNIHTLRGVLFSVLPLLSAGVLLTGCDNVPTEMEDYRAEPFLTGFLTSGEPVSEIYLERVAPLIGFYDPRNSGIVGANVIIFGGGDTLTLAEDPAYRGRYIPAAGQSLTPRGKIRYRIEARTLQGELVWAETVVPDPFAHVESYLMKRDGTRIPVADGDTLARDMPNLFFRWDPVDSAGGYQGLGVTLVPRDSLVPLDPDWDAAEDSIEEEERTKGGFMVVRDDQRTITLPWIIFNWQGPHRLELLAISRDYYDYLFSLFRVQQGLIEKATSNVHGGFGIFGGISKHTLDIYMRKVE